MPHHDKQIKLYAIVDGKEYAIKGNVDHCAMAMERCLHHQLGYINLDKPWQVLKRLYKLRLRHSNPLITLSTGKYMRKTRIYTQYDIHRAVGEIVGLV